MEFLYNKVHNEWLNLATNTGLFGLGSHLLLIVWFAIWILKARPTAAGQTLMLWILSAILGVETVNLFGFSTVTTETYRYLFMGMAVMIVNREQRTENRELGKNFYHLLLIVYCLLFSWPSFYSIVQISRLYSADLKYNLGRQYYSAGIIGEAINPLYQAVNLVPGEPVFRNELAEISIGCRSFNLDRRQKKSSS